MKKLILLIILILGIGMIACESTSQKKDKLMEIQTIKDSMGQILMANDTVYIISSNRQDTVAVYMKEEKGPYGVKYNIFCTKGYNVEKCFHTNQQ